MCFTDISLDLDLDSNSVEYKFSVPVLYVGAEETRHAVALYIVLANGCIFRLTFAHPAVLEPPVLGKADSVFLHQQNGISWLSGVLPHLVGGQGRVLVVATNNGALAAHILPSLDGHQHELYRTVPLQRMPTMRRLLGFIPNLLGTDANSSAVRAVGVVQARGWHFIFSLTADLVLTGTRFNVTEAEPALQTVLHQSLADVLSDSAIAMTATSPDAGHLLRIAPLSADQSHATLAVALALGAHSRVSV